MKRRIFSTATAILVCLAVFLCACGKNTDSGSTTEQTVSSPWSEAQVFSLPAETPTAAQSGKQAEKAQTDTATILHRIQAARAVYGLFLESRPQLDKSDSIEAEEGLTAYRVTDPKLDTWEKLQAYVSGYFSDKITQQLLSVGMYIEYDNKLYALDVGMQTAHSDQMQAELTGQTDTAEHYRLTVRADKQEKTYDFEYAKQEDGKWVFTHFEAY